MKKDGMKLNEGDKILFKIDRETEVKTGEIIHNYDPAFLVKLEDDAKTVHVYRSEIISKFERK